MIHPEEEARANLYGLIARLFYAAPDAQLISELLQAPAIEEEGKAGSLGATWSELARARRKLDRSQNASCMMPASKRTSRESRTPQRLLRPVHRFRIRRAHL